MQLAAPASVHWLSGSCPAATLVHVPMVPLSAHDLQFALQVVAQHTPWAQTPLVHSVPALQAVPFVFFVHTPPLQMLGLLQSALVVQLVLHAPVPQRYGSQLDAVPAWQVPVPLQVRREVSVAPVQLAAAHWVPETYRRQAPLPLQKPSVPQAAAPLSVHWLSGSCPAGTFVHVPTVPVSAHDWQVPVQAALQQNPWAQNPDAHSVPAPQAAPIDFLPQLPALQTLGLLQSAFVVQVVLHAPVPQAKGSQLEVVAA